MIFSYRTRRFLGRFFRTLITVIVSCVILVLLWLLWMQRFVIYTPEGAVFDFDGPRPQGQAVQAKPTVPPSSIGIQYYQPEPEQPKPVGLQQLKGGYVVLNDLKGDLPALQESLLSLPEGTAIMMDVKGIWGTFYYPTKVGESTVSSLDMEQVAAFMAALNDSGLYTIARMPAFKDHDYARNHQSCGLATPGGYLHAGSDKCYWLEPYNDTVLTYLVQLTMELKKLGFDEIVFKDFCFPETENLSYTGDRAAAIEKAAQTLATACADESFIVSFQSADLAFPLPEGNCRLYMENIAAADVADTLAQLGFPDSDKRVVMLAGSTDTRYDACGVLRPIDLLI